MRAKRGVQSAAAIAVFSGGLLVQTAAFAATPPCANPAEVTALNVRLLQTELMVAALSCQKKTSYNTFVQQFKSELVGHGKTLRAMFTRHYGKSAEKHINTFVTGVANKASLRSSQAEGYCERSAGFFADVLNISPADLSDFASSQSFSGTYGLATCTADLQPVAGDPVVRAR